MRRLLITALAMLVLLLAGATLFALHSETALAWVAARVSAHYAGRLTVGGVNGTLVGPVTLKDVEIRGGGFHARIATLSLDWQPLLLLVRRASISHLRADGVQIELAPAARHTPFRFVRPRPPHLPLSISLNDLSVSQLTLRAPQLAGPLQIARLSLMARLDNRSWTLRGLRAAGAGLRLAGRGDWEFHRGERVNASFDWNFTLPQGTALAGHAEAAGDAGLIRLKAGLNAPFSLSAEADLQDPFRAPRWRGRLAFSRLDPVRLRAGWPAAEARGELRFSGDPAATLLSGAGSMHQPGTGDWRERFELRLAGDTLTVRRLDLERAAGSMRLALGGQLRFTGNTIEPDLSGTWQNLALPLMGEADAGPWLSSPRGRLRFTGQAGRVRLVMDGTLNDGGSFEAQATAALQPPNAWRLTAAASGFELHVPAIRGAAALPAMDWRLAAHGDTTHTQLDRFNAAWLGGKLQAHGRFRHGDSGNWRLAVRGQQLDPERIWPELAGRLGFDAAVSGTLGPQRRWQLALTQLTGSLRGAPLAASGTLTHAGTAWSVDRLKLRVGDNRAVISGDLGGTPRLQWDVDAPALAVLWPDLRGSLKSTGRAALGGATPRIAFTLAARRFAYQKYALQALDLGVHMDGTAANGKATFTARGLTLPQVTVDELTAAARGTLAAHTLDMALSSPLGKLSVAGHGAYLRNHWQGALTSVRFAPSAAGEWRNEVPWPISIASGRAALAVSCLTQEAARACLQADWQKQSWKAQATLAAVPLADLGALLPSGLEFAGSFGGTLTASGGAAGEVVDLSADLSPGAIYNLINRRRVALLSFSSGAARLRADTGGVTGTLGWTLKDGGYMHIETRMTRGGSPALSGRISGEMHDFDLIPALIPEVGGLSGRLSIDLTLAGTPADPKFSGSASLHDGAVSVPRVGLHIRDLLLNLKGDGSALTLDGQAHSGNGTLDYQSRAVKQAGAWHAEGTLQGENFRVADIPEAQVEVSPTLSFKLSGRDLYLDGEVRVPDARLRPRDLSQAAQVSSDQVIVGANGEPAAEQWRVHTRVRAVMGDDVSIEGFGLTGRISGSVLAVDEPGHYTSGSGELQIVDGHYTAYGQKLDIDRGRLMFNGGIISNPALDIRALRPPAHPETLVPGGNEQKVGVTVRGTLHDPRVLLFSDPPLPQSQLLSYLLTGQTGVDQSQSPLIGAPPTTTGSSLALAGGQVLAAEVGQRIGLSDVSVQNVALANGSSTAAMFLGKYLSPRLYISYGVGLYQPINTVRIRYQLSTKWILEAESGIASSADLIYSIEH